MIEQRNRGLLLARRAAIDVAQGDYLIFVDSDDALRADALHVIDQLLSRTDVDVLLFQASRSPLFDVPYFNHEGLYEDMVDGEFVPNETMRKQLALTAQREFNVGKSHSSRLHWPRVRFRGI